MAYGFLVILSRFGSWTKPWNMIAAAWQNWLSLYPYLRSRFWFSPLLISQTKYRFVWVNFFCFGDTEINLARQPATLPQAQGLERVASICAKRNVRMPSSLIIMGDNTVRELKNQFCTSYLGALVSRRKLRLCAAFFLRKSHTHDRIDQMWGVLSRRISSTDTILNDSDTVKTIEMELSRVGVRQWLGSRCEVHVEKMNCVRRLGRNLKCDMSFLFEFLQTKY